MDVNFAPEDEAFRAEVRSFIEENYPKHLVWIKPGTTQTKTLFPELAERRDEVLDRLAGYHAGLSISTKVCSIPISVARNSPTACTPKRSVA